MTFVSFSPFEPMDYARDRLNRLFADMEESSQHHSHWKPSVELLDTGDNLILRLSLGGVNRQDLDIEVTRDSVKVAGERHRVASDSASCLYTEFDYGQFQRHISLPVEIINTKVKAGYEDGVLTLTLPKVEEAKHRVVKVSLDGVQDNPVLSEAEDTSEVEMATA
ncbi:MAG: Hsp20/alpha crystallin family protein [Cyanobacteria bacterium P01_G01_bin.19]